MKERSEQIMESVMRERDKRNKEYKVPNAHVQNFKKYVQDRAEQLRRAVEPQQPSAA